MSLVLFVSAMLIGPDAQPGTQFWRDEHQSIMHASAERLRPCPDVVVPRLVALYTLLDEAEDLPAHERSRMRKSLESRLVRQLEELVREHNRQVAKRPPRRMPQSFSGGGAANIASPLIELIVTTVAPDSWRSQGGPASISYYAQNPALVVRQSQSAHEQIAELLQALR
jgi:hypothetical protein